MKTIGIIGGMGPEATAALYTQIIRIFQRRFNARHDSDYPPIIIYSLPAPDVVERNEDEKRLVDMLRDAAQKVEKAGADFFVVACNTVQKYLPAMNEVVSIPSLDLNEEIAQAAAERGYKKVCLFGSEATLREGLLEHACGKKGVNVVIPPPSDRPALTRVIMTILSGCSYTEARKDLQKMISNLRESDVQAVVLACTDLGLAVGEQDVGLPLVDSVEVLAEAAVRMSTA
jgi:aspartate racemase